MWRSIWDKSEGQVLLLVMMVVMVLFILVTSLSTITTHTRTNMIKEYYFTQALYSAEAGIEKTVAKIINDVKWYNNLQFYDIEDYLDNDVEFAQVFSSTYLSDGVTFEVSVKKNDRNTGTSILIKSVGKCKDKDELLAQKTLYCEVAVFTANDYFQGLCILPENAQDIGANCNIVVNSNLIINGNLKYSENLNLNEDVFASGTLSCNCTGTEYPNYDYIPPFPDLEFYNDVQYDFHYDKEFNSSENKVAQYRGACYVDGNIYICGYYQGKAVFFSTGNINVGGSLIPLNEDGDIDLDMGGITLISLGDITIENCDVYANLIAKGTLRVKGDVQLFGSACVTGVESEDDADGITTLTFNYESCLTPQSDLTLVNTKTINWREMYPVFRNNKYN